jgi:hypothetical protein
MVGRIFTMLSPVLRLISDFLKCCFFKLNVLLYLFMFPVHAVAFEDPAASVASGEISKEETYAKVQTNLQALRRPHLVIVVSLRNDDRAV